MRSKRRIRREGPSIQVEDMVVARKSVGILGEGEVGVVIASYKPKKDRFLDIKTTRGQVQTRVSVKHVRKL